MLFVALRSAATEEHRHRSQQPRRARHDTDEGPPLAQYAKLDDLRAVNAVAGRAVLPRTAVAATAWPVRQCSWTLEPGELSPEMSRRFFAAHAIRATPVPTMYAAAEHVALIIAALRKARSIGYYVVSATRRLRRLRVVLQKYVRFRRALMATWLERWAAADDVMRQRALRRFNDRVAGLGPITATRARIQVRSGVDDGPDCTPRNAAAVVQARTARPPALRPRDMAVIMQRPPPLEERRAALSTLLGLSYAQFARQWRAHKQSTARASAFAERQCNALFGNALSAPELAHRYHAALPPSYQCAISVPLLRETLEKQRVLQERRRAVVRNKETMATVVATLRRLGCRPPATPDSPTATRPSVDVGRSRGSSVFVTESIAPSRVPVPPSLRSRPSDVGKAPPRCPPPRAMTQPPPPSPAHTCRPSGRWMDGCLRGPVDSATGGVLPAFSLPLGDVVPPPTPPSTATLSRSDVARRVLPLLGTVPPPRRPTPLPGASSARAASTRPLPRSVDRGAATARGALSADVRVGRPLGASSARPGL